MFDRSRRALEAARASAEETDLILVTGSFYTVADAHRALGPSPSRTMPIESTLLIVKPDGVRRGLIGEVLRRVEAKGLVIDSMRQLTIDRALAEQHYAEHVDKPFFGELVDFITGRTRRGREGERRTGDRGVASPHGRDRPDQGSARVDPG